LPTPAAAATTTTHVQLKLQ